MSKVKANATGKRRSVDIGEIDAGNRAAPLVPDLSPAQKAMIYEQLEKSLVLSQIVSEPQVGHKAARCETVDEVRELKRVESKSHKIGRKIKGLFMNDQTKIPSRQQSMDDRLHGRRSHAINNDNDDYFEDDELYRYR
ncbi:protein of unknown function [Taphrina deformans PYCC 5710]|uniref:Uncharacterized protein n=1 Tax=Taphrina deformans (strain PYCC 5710 / ATCC 11124 / CBS 356.35 / IMI 108563 / JCM 9778 / NBRC 8474) TaxID=1097556 RepID=R4XF26_TAPDE|nr:protein of unknown function [Taphrina deformans PYCC 5710]|eukprot:CCG84243.1 protein of unknown function [Taphrina deformans PYCC 5710]